ncbi:Abi family protein [Nibrella viscosa]|uniref:Abi family protein n=1 Tax=Nibrella viscosa TaxID=1084524 RepID=A0ABP8KIM0_9BACT
MKYTKPALTIPQQIQQLKQRGLLITDIAEAERQLLNISYYRLAGYWWAMQDDKQQHTFKPGSTFENAVSLYNFDRELRLLVFGIIERIEIGVRTRMIYQLSHEFDPWWFTDPKLFKDVSAHQRTLESIRKEIARSEDTFLVHHRQTYNTDSRLPPAWKSLEVVSLGNLSKLYGNLKSSVRSKDRIAADLKLVNQTFMPSWMQTFTQIRNICAHHGRLWNKNLPGRPKLLPKPPAPWLTWVPPVTEHHRLYVHLCCMKYMLNVIVPGNRFTQKLSGLLSKYPNIDINALGLPSSWQNEPLWQS